MRERFQMGSVKVKGSSYIGQFRDEDGCGRSRALGRVSEITKAEAWKRLAAILEPINNRSLGASGEQNLSAFVEHIYLPFYLRKWKGSTAETNLDRIRRYISGEFGSSTLHRLTRDELQTFLDRKSASGLSFSVVDHLRWDLRQILRMAVSEGALQKNPAELLFTPRETRHSPRRVPNWEELRKVFSVLDLRERLIYMLAFVAGMRPSEIFGLKWNRIHDCRAEIVQRVYRGKVDSPKTTRSRREAALADDLVELIEQWKAMSIGIGSDAWLFPSEKLTTPLAKENCWRRNIKPRLAPLGLEWINFQALRRAHSSLARAAGEDPKAVADQLGHGIGVNTDVYTVTPIERSRQAVNRLADGLRVM